MGHDKTEFQSIVSDEIMENQGQTVTAKLTDNHKAIIIEIGDSVHDAAYTAQEARDLAHDVQQRSEIKWDKDTGELIMYLWDLADVVDGRLDPDEVREKWSGGVDVDPKDVVYRDTELRKREGEK